jgi:hypothetical protein
MPDLMAGCDNVEEYVEAGCVYDKASCHYFGFSLGNPVGETIE